MAADKAIAEREIPPMIIVMPDGGAAVWTEEEIVGRKFIGQSFRR